jgi:Fic family protein
MRWYKDITLLEDYRNILDRLHNKWQKVHQARPLTNNLLSKISHELSLEWTYHSNSIEGNTLNLNETRVILEHGMTIRGKSLREHFEVVNHQDAIDYITSLVSRDFVLTQDDILDVHRIVMTKIEKDFAGRYRNGGVRIGGANFLPPNALKVPDLMSSLIAHLTDETADWPVIWTATLFHHHFVHIHPFFDGNGRTARLLMNFILMKEGYPPAIILQQDRKKYYDALNQANQGRYDKLFLLILQAVERSLNIYLHVLPSATDDDDYAYISDIVAEPSFPYGQEYVSLLARRGLIDAYKEGRNWLTKRSAVKAYWHSKQNK